VGEINPGVDGAEGFQFREQQPVKPPAENHPEKSGKGPEQPAEKFLAPEMEEMAFVFTDKAGDDVHGFLIQTGYADAQILVVNILKLGYKISVFLKNSYVKKDIIMININISEAQARLPELLSLVSKGNEIIISGDDIPLAKIVPLSTTPKKRIPGLNKGQIHMSDNFDDPLPDDFWAAGE